MKSEFLSKEKKIVKKTFCYKMLVKENFGPKENFWQVFNSILINNEFTPKNNEFYS